MANGYSATYGTMNATATFRNSGGMGGMGGGAAAPQAARQNQLKEQNLNYGKDVRFESVYQQSN